ncbi:relaxase/mobilization nuclease domain protein [Burkholderia pseudomallei MSHR983]|uniref:relaxase/mobilization nuclease domain-containing protein n=1 Tax=Burkholderia pseudomallei TaxID=28450 RepID=UPI000536CB29|nr:relaxase/mobilization nuclease domain-containing protein [Burkholderia pseudomallei]KGU63225.1 relaxase/mobilization nuclease domain protein [Burkholderia pseudomallei MSHR983]
MIVRIFNSGTSGGEAPVRYLLSDTDHAGQKRSVEPVVLAGSPDLTIATINTITRKHKYVSGAIAFRDQEQPSREQIMDIIGRFKETVCPGLDARHYNSLFILHREKGNSEIHFVVPSLELTTGRRLSIHPPGPRNIALYDAFTKVMNHELGYEQVIPDPLKLALSDFERKVPEGQRDRSNKLHLHKHLARAIRRGEITNRDQLCQHLEEQFGVTITRKGVDYISVKFPGSQKAKRMRGSLYRADADYMQLVDLYRRPPPARLTDAEYRQHKTALTELVAERKQFFSAAYLQPKQLRAYKARTALHPKPMRHRRSIPHNHKETKTMHLELNAIKRIASDALSVARQIRAERPVFAPADRTTVVSRIRGLRDEAYQSSKTDLSEHAAMDTVHEVEGALGEIESDLSAATADVSHAKTPEQRRKAEERVAKLVAQKNRLLQQLAQAKLRQINAGAKR